jgi:hypothetical protein
MRVIHLSNASAASACRDAQPFMVAGLMIRMTALCSQLLRKARGVFAAIAAGRGDKSILPFGKTISREGSELR